MNYLPELLVFLATELPYCSLFVLGPEKSRLFVAQGEVGSNYQVAHQLLGLVALRFPASRVVVHTDDLVLYHAFRGEFDFYAESLPFSSWRGLCGETGNAVEYVRVSSKVPHPHQVLARNGLEQARLLPPGGLRESYTDWL